jgi:hypothetical protein
MLGTTAPYISTTVSDILSETSLDLEEIEKITYLIVHSLLNDYKDVWEYLLDTQSERNLLLNKLEIERKKSIGVYNANKKLVSNIVELKKEVEKLKSEIEGNRLVNV